MKFKNLMMAIILVTIVTGSYAQTPLKEFKAGSIFYVSLPDYMSRTVGLNSAATFQYKNAVKDVYGFVIIDDKEEMALADLKYGSINEFFEDFTKDFLEGEDKRKLSKPVYEKKGDLNFAECDASYFDKDADAEIYYHVGVVETKTAFYKVLSWALLENKEKFKADFQSILYSVKD